MKLFLLILLAPLNVLAEPIIASQHIHVLSNSQAVAEESFLKSQKALMIYDNTTKKVHGSFYAVSDTIFDPDIAEHRYENAPKDAFGVPTICMTSGNEDPRCLQGFRGNNRPSECHIIPQQRRYVAFHSHDWRQVTRFLSSNETEVLSWCRDGVATREFTMETRRPFIFNTRNTVYLYTPNQNMSVEITHSVPWTNVIQAATPSPKNGQVQGRVSAIGIEDQIIKAFPGIENGPITYSNESMGYVNGQGAEVTTTPQWTQTVELDGVWLVFKLGQEAL